MTVKFGRDELASRLPEVTYVPAFSRLPYADAMNYREFIEACEEEFSGRDVSFPLPHETQWLVQVETSGVPVRGAVRPNPLPEMVHGLFWKLWRKVEQQDAK